MAKIKKLPSARVISGFKGKIDFYVHDGVPIARSWPRKPSQARNPQVQAQWPAFAYSAHFWNYLPPDIQSAYTTMAKRSGLNGRDLSARAYLGGLYAYPIGE